MPARPSPNATTPVCETGQLHAPGDSTPVAVGTAAWFAWLAGPDHSTFYLRDPAGAYTARREQRRGGHYWYAYAKRGARLRKTYLGRSADLTWARLLAAAETLTTGPRPVRPALVLAAKLGVPPLRAATVPRPRLTALLAGLRARPLTLLSAPPGFGKTTLLCQWAAQRAGPPVAWLSLDAGDNDPLRFWAHLVSAVAADFPSAASAALTVLAGPTPTGAAVVSALFAGLPPNAALALVLDDYHVIDHAAIHAALAFALEHLPAQWRVIIASRVDPADLPLPRLRAQGRLTEIRADDLRLTPAEATLFLRQATGRAVPTAVAQALAAQTEGWAAALQLAALALPADDAAPPPRPSPVGVPAAAQRQVFDYLAAEVLQRQPPATQRFLLHTALLDRLSAGLCAAVVGELPADFLEHLERQNLFLVPLDAERRWYRYHALFAEFLRARLAHSASAAAVRALHARAAAWFEAQHDTASAIDHWLAAEDYPRAAGLIDCDAELLMAQGAITTIARRLAALPAAIVHGSSSLSIWQAWCFCLNNQLASVEPALAQAAARLQGAEAYAARAPAAEAAQVRQSVAAGLGQLAVIRAQAARQRGDYPGAAHWAHTALTYLPAQEIRMRSLVALTLGQAHQAEGDVHAAERAFDDAARLISATQHPFIHLNTLSAQAWLRVEQGQLHTAAALYRRARAWAQTHGGAALAALTGLALADLLREWNDLAAAAAHLAADLPLVALAGHTDSYISGLLMQSRVQQALGQPAAASASLAAAEQLGPPNTWQHNGAVLAAWRARLALAQADPAAAQRWAIAYAATRDPSPLTPAARYVHEVEDLTLARVWFTTGSPAAVAQAQALLAALLPAAEAAGRRTRALEIRLLQALALAAAGDQANAVQALTHALHQAEPEGYVRLFVDEGPAFTRLLRTLGRAAGVSARYLATLRRAAGLPLTVEADLGGEAAAPLAPLSTREQEVLRLLAEGLSNREIAQRLSIALGTAQWHTKSIYRKLGVPNRTRAAALARTLGLLV